MGKLKECLMCVTKRLICSQMIRSLSMHALHRGRSDCVCIPHVSQLFQITDCQI